MQPQTIHTLLAGIPYGIAHRIPSNCTFKELFYYADSRFGYTLKQIDDKHFIRICPCCHR